MLKHFLPGQRDSGPNTDHAFGIQRFNPTILLSVILVSFGCSNEPLDEQSLSALPDENSVAETPGHEHKQPTFITTSLAADNQVHFIGTLWQDGTSSPTLSIVVTIQQAAPNPRHLSGLTFLVKKRW